MITHDAYGTFRAKLLTRIFAGKPTPNQVADVLQKHKAKYPQISTEEIGRYRSWGDSWPVGQPLVGMIQERGWASVPDFPLSSEGKNPLE